MNRGWEAPEKEGAGLRFLYRTAPGRAALKLLSGRAVSRLAGRFMDSPLSRPLIGSFVRRNGIRLEDYAERRFACFNDFFCRRIRPELRPLPEDPALLFAPCDGRLSAWRVDEGLVLDLKHSRYTLDELFAGDPVAARYWDGVCLVFRLCVDDYHRYCYPDSGVKEQNVHIQGVYHTVNPIAYKKYAVLKENTREYTLLHSDHFDDIIIMEVGATLVGRISNLHGACRVKKGEQKGHFDFGGSTVAVLVKPDILRIDDDILRNNRDGCETVIKYGERIGTKIR